MIKAITTNKIIGFGILILIIACKTYTIPTESFKEQMKNSTAVNLEPVEINNPLSFNHKLNYFANQIDTIHVLDKNGQKTTLANSPAIEMRITQQNGKKFIVYFDTVTLENDTLKGNRSRFLPHLERVIPFDSIVRIEVQNGGKKFEYAE